MQAHQYIIRETGEIVTENLIGDRSIQLLYSNIREHAPAMFRALTSKQMSGFLGMMHFDLQRTFAQNRKHQLLHKMHINLEECVATADELNTPRKIFERQIRYWDVRPMDTAPEAVVSSADAKVLLGSLTETPDLFIKEKFFSVDELLGSPSWYQYFKDADFAVFRLTPDKYHYNHVPVRGKVLDHYTLSGGYHSCNPQAIISVASLYTKNRRTVTILDTDIPGGANIGKVAMIELVALMIGDLVQCYSEYRYDNSQPVAKGMILEKGAPKSLYRPGSSTDILLFESGRIQFSEDLLANSRRTDVASRFSSGFKQPLVETDIKVRSTIAAAL